MATRWPPPDTRCDTDIVEGVAAGLYAYQLSYWFHAFEPSRFLTSLACEEDATVLRAVAHFVGSSGLGNPRSIGDPSNPNAVKVMGAMRLAQGQPFFTSTIRAAASAQQQPTCHLFAFAQGAGHSGWAAP